MRILYLYPHPVARDLERVYLGESPTDRMYGLVELRRRGHDVSVADSRFHGRTGACVRWLRRQSINACDVKTIQAIREHDVVVVKDEFSTAVTAACRLLGKPVVYLDAPVNLPRRAWKHAVFRLNLRLATHHVLYSASQADLWARRYAVPREKFVVLPYSIDLDFYHPLAPAPSHDRPYVLSIGRDVARRFRTLVEAMDGLGMDLKIVTRPYLMTDVPRPAWVEVQDDLSYPELFRLYAGAEMAAIPLTKGITYPAGVRAMLECMALQTPAVTTRTPVLVEYAAEGEGVVYVEPEDPVTLRRAIVAVREEAGLRRRLAAAGREAVAARFGMEAFGARLEAALEGRPSSPAFIAR